MRLTLLLSAILFSAVATFAAPAKRVTNTEFEDGTGSSKEVDPENKRSTETFFEIGANGKNKERYKIVKQLDSRMQPVSGIYYNPAGKVFQKSTYTLDGADRMIQEVIYDGKDQLVCTKNYVWGTRYGQPTVVRVDIYDRYGKLTNKQNMPARNPAAQVTKKR